MKSPMYPNLEEVFRNGISDNINWIKVQKPFKFDSQYFQPGKLLYVPKKAFTEHRDSLTVYGFPDGNLHLLPYNIEGDFLSCEKNGEVAGKLFTLAIDENNNVDVQISVTDNNVINENDNDDKQKSDVTNMIKEVGDFFRKPSSSSYEKNVEDLLNGNENSLINNTNVNGTRNKESPHLILRNTYPGNSKRRNVPYENVTITTPKNNENQVTPEKKIPSKPRPIITVGNLTTNVMDQYLCDQTGELTEQPDQQNEGLTRKSHIVKPSFMNNDKVKSLPAALHSLAMQPESCCDRQQKVLTLNNEKTFTSYFKKSDTHLITSQSKRQGYNGSQSKQGFDKRFSIYGGLDYVPMATVQVTMETFEKKAILHHQNSNNLTQKDYEDMTHPEVIIPQFFQPDDMFKVKLRTRAKSATFQRMKKKSPSLKKKGARNANDKERLSKTKSIAGLGGDFSSGQLQSLSDINPRKKKELAALRNRKSKKKEGGEKRRTVGKTITPYERLMVEVANFQDENSDIEEYDESRLSKRKGFNRFESRLVYHTIHGWQPNLNESDVGKELPFAEDYSVPGLQFFLKDTLGNENLAKYMRDYHVDGCLMKFIVMDDLILDDQMFDQSFLTIDELKRLRTSFYPNRLRCYAMDNKTVEEVKHKTVHCV